MHTQRPRAGEAEQRHDALTQMDAPRALARDYPQSKAKYRAGFLAQNSAPMQKVLGTGAAERAARSARSGSRTAARPASAPRAAPARTTAAARRSPATSKRRRKRRAAGSRQAAKPRHQRQGRAGPVACRWPCAMAREHRAVCKQMRDRVAGAAAGSSAARVRMRRIRGRARVRRIGGFGRIARGRHSRWAGAYLLMPRVSQSTTTAAMVTSQSVPLL